MKKYKILDNRLVILDTETLELTKGVYEYGIINDTFLLEKDGVVDIDGINTEVKAGDVLIIGRGIYNDDTEKRDDNKIFLLSVDLPFCKYYKEYLDASKLRENRLMLNDCNTNSCKCSSGC